MDPGVIYIYIYRGKNRADPSVVVPGTPVARDPGRCQGPGRPQHSVLGTRAVARDTV